MSIDLGSQSRVLWDWLTARVNNEPIPPQSPGGTSLFKKPKRIYRGRVTDPAGEPGHFLIGIFPEVPAGFHDSRPGLNGRAWVHCWSDTLDNAERMYEWLKRLVLDPYPVEIGGRMVIELGVSKGSQVEDMVNRATAVPLLIDIETLAEEAA